MNTIQATVRMGYLLPLLLLSTTSQAEGNLTISSFNKAKQVMQKNIYTSPELQTTLYCGARFDSDKNVTLPKGFQTDKYKKRLARWEAEHVVPAENFGRTFSGIFCLILQLTLIGWIPAAIWSTYALSQYTTDKKIASLEKPES